MNIENGARPFLKWVGGKRSVLDQLERLFPVDFNNYFEPFVGGGAVVFKIKSRSATINDINPSLIGAYINIRDNLDAILERLKKLQSQYYGYDEDRQKEMFYRIRSEFNNIKDKSSLDKTAFLIFLNKTCFNGMYRENRRGEFNVPFGRAKKPTICDEINLSLVSEALKRAVILNGSYEDAVKNAKKGDFIYFDPPYYPLNPTSSFTSYHEKDFLEKDQIKLKELVDELTKRGCMVMLSNSYTKFILNLYKDYNNHKIYVGRSINAKGSGRGKVAEVVITNY